MEIGKVEKGIPVPEHQLKKYPFDELEVGDSFLIKFSVDEAKTAVRRMSVAKHRAQKKLNRKFVYRTVTKGTSGTDIRVWRTK
jgi:hypothetical protein